MLKLLFISLLFISIGCSHSSPKNPPTAYDDMDNPLINPSKAIQDKPRALSPESKKASESFLTPYSSGTDAVINAALLGAAKGLGAILSADPQREDLQGSCRYGDPTNLSMSSPCNHVKVLLIDEKNTILVTTETNENGDFRFYMPSDLSCYVQVVDRKGRMAQLPQKVSRGKTVSLFLTP